VIVKLAKPDPAIKALARWDPAVERVGLVKPGDLIMSLVIADGAKEQDTVLWFIEAFGYWERLLSTEKLLAAPTLLPNKIIRASA
jgi:hypothetical protein